MCERVNGDLIEGFSSTLQMLYKGYFRWKIPLGRLRPVEFYCAEKFLKIPFFAHSDDGWDHLNPSHPSNHDLNVVDNALLLLAKPIQPHKNRVSWHNFSDH